MSINYLYTQFHAPCLNGSLLIAIKLETKFKCLHGSYIVLQSTTKSLTTIYFYELYCWYHTLSGIHTKFTKNW